MTSALLNGSSRSNQISKGFQVSALLSNGVGSSLFAPTSPALNSSTGTYFRTGNCVGVLVPPIIGSPTGAAVLNLPPLPGSFAPSILPAQSQLFMVQNGPGLVPGIATAYTDRIVVGPLAGLNGLTPNTTTGTQAFSGSTSNCGIPYATAITFMTSN